MTTTNISRREKTISFVLPDGMAIGGVTTWSIEMCRRLAKMGQSAYLIKHSNYYNPHLEIELPPNISSIDCTGNINPHHPSLNNRHIPSFLRCYQSRLPGIIIPNWSYGTYATCASIALENSDDLRVIGFAHSDEIDYYEWLTHYEPIIHRFVAVSQEIAAKLTEYLPHRHNDIVIRPYAVAVPELLNRTYSSPEEPVQLIYAGRISQRQKRIFDLVHLVKVLAGEDVDFQLRIIGAGIDKESLRRRINSLDLSTAQRVTFEDSQLPPAMPDIWRSADIFILVSDYEGTSIAMLEAMAQGCVPVVTQVSGTLAVINHDSNGFLVPVGATTQMANIIKELATDRDKLARIGHRAYASTQSRFSYGDYINWFLETAHYVWNQPPRVWPADKPLIPPGRIKITPADLSGTIRGDREAFKNLLIKLSARPGLHWLYNYRHIAKRFIDKP